jgi:hypothetical protein
VAARRWLATRQATDLDAPLVLIAVRWVACLRVWTADQRLGE